MTTMLRQTASRARRFALRSILVIAASFAAVSCGGPPGHYPVTGKILCNGEPAEGVDVLFHLKGDTDPDPHTPHGSTDESGVFTLECKDGPGALPGEYTVGIRWLDYNTPEGKNLRGKNKIRYKTYPEDMLKGRYSDLANPKFFATIKSEKNELPPFEITRDPNEKSYLSK
jgi:hypothetical protein